MSTRSAFALTLIFLLTILASAGSANAQSTSCQAQGEAGSCMQSFYASIAAKAAWNTSDSDWRFGILQSTNAAGETTIETFVKNESGSDKPLHTNFRNTLAITGPNGPSSFSLPNICLALGTSIGCGSVIVPAHGIIKLYEVTTAKVGLKSGASYTAALIFGFDQQANKEQASGSSATLTFRI